MLRGLVLYMALIRARGSINPAHLKQIAAELSDPMARRLIAMAELVAYAYRAQDSSIPA